MTTKQKRKLLKKRDEATASEEAVPAAVEAAEEQPQMEKVNLVQVEEKQKVLLAQQEFLDETGLLGFDFDEFEYDLEQLERHGESENAVDSAMFANI